MLSTLCSIQTFARPGSHGSFQPALAHLSCPRKVNHSRPSLELMLATPLMQRRSISFGNSGQENAANKKVDGLSAQTKYANRILTYANDGDLKLNFMGRVAHQELIDEENNRVHYLRRHRRFLLYTCAWGLTAMASWYILHCMHYHPHWLELIGGISPIAAFISTAVAGDAFVESKKHQIRSNQLYHEICLKYQAHPSPPLLLSSSSPLEK